MCLNVKFLSTILKYEQAWWLFGVHKPKLEALFLHMTSFVPDRDKWIWQETFQVMKN
jgi:hypothetical protein